MTLIDTMMTTCVMIDRQTASDGAGGVTTTYVIGAEFPAAVTVDTSLEAQIAGAQDVRQQYKITTHRNVILHYNDIVKRIGDGVTFRVISQQADVTSPAVSSLDIAQVTAERWVI